MTVVSSVVLGFRVSVMVDSLSVAWVIDLDDMTSIMEILAQFDM